MPDGNRSQKSAWFEKANKVVQRGAAFETFHLKMTQQKHHPEKAENWWLEDYFSAWEGCFQRRAVSFGEHSSIFRSNTSIFLD